MLPRMTSISWNYQVMIEKALANTTNQLSQNDNKIWRKSVLICLGRREML